MSNLILTIEAQGKVAYEFAERSSTIGRAPDNRIIIDDPSVSNRYAMLEPSGKEYRLKDFESTNGTKVSGVPITDTLLHFEDRIRFGVIEARFEAEMRRPSRKDRHHAIRCGSLSSASPQSLRSLSRQHDRRVFHARAVICTAICENLRNFVD